MSRLPKNNGLFDTELELSGSFDLEEEYKEQLPCDLQEMIQNKLNLHDAHLLNSMVNTELTSIYDIEENWQLSQFWYDEATANFLAERALESVNPDIGQIALISCPSLYMAIKNINSTVTVKLFEIDERFKVFKEDFIKYNYNFPLFLLEEYCSKFDIVIVDPPFLSEECIIKAGITAKFITRKKIIMCTGTIVADMVKDFVGCNITEFKPRHKNNLTNDFACYINYTSQNFTDLEQTT